MTSKAVSSMDKEMRLCVCVCLFVCMYVCYVYIYI